MDTDEKKPAAPYSDRFQNFVPNSTKRTSNIFPAYDRQDQLHRGPRVCNRPTYALRLRAEPGVDAIHALRAVLKTMLRRYGLRCLSAHEEKGGGE